MWRLRGEEDEEEGIGELGGGFAHRALLMGTQCAERQEAAHSSRQHCHHRGRDKVGGWEREGERGYYSPTLFIGYHWGAHRHARTKALNIRTSTRRHWATHTHTHIDRTHACTQTCRYSGTQADKDARRNKEMSKTHIHAQSRRAAWLSESYKSQASIQFIRELLAAVLV